MPNQLHVEILSYGAEIWNTWRNEDPNMVIELDQLDLSKLVSPGAVGNFIITNPFDDIDLSGANLIGSNLQGISLINADLRGADLIGANLLGASLHGANLSNANLNGAKLSGAYLLGAKLIGADLEGADLRGANLMRADFTGANLAHADLTGTFLEHATFIGTKVDQAVISNSWVYGANVWDMMGEFKEQKDLIITPAGTAGITADNIKVAQFIYLILNNKEIRDVINTLTSKSVLILGRFSIAERKEILDAIRVKLREHDLLPIVFDFDRPVNKDFTETIKTLAGLSLFVIADVTNPRSSPLELQATVPDYQIPFVPIIQQGEDPFAMMVDLQKKYNWVLDTLEYDSLDTLVKVLKPAIIDAAMEKHNELRLIKAKKPKVRSAKDYLD